MMRRGTPLLDLRSLGTLERGSFLRRPNRFVALVRTPEGTARVHVADTGRLEEILTEGRELLLVKNRPGLKTDYTLVAAMMEEGWVLINTRVHAHIGRRAIEGGALGFVPSTIRQEVLFGHSRLDYRVDDTFVELKGCSLVQERRCLFPNAPTSRGRRHLGALADAVRRGYGAYLLILGLRRCRCFAPHRERDPLFAEALTEALEEGVKFRGFFVGITDLTVCYDGILELCDAWISDRENIGGKRD